ncbi:MAG: inorganic pyrophosphatase, inorganic pyrophosphatase [Parcubacteria group bacterium GW2011_GWC1_38_6]|nr:MAG: inorganic pyrophosphatase, inorganic pyrophosphatase [Parcubacteria group bacterium GW2011_GWC1_38_6]
MEINNLSAGKNPPKEINVFIEIPQGSSVKYELDKDSGVLKVDRFLHTSMVFPFNYGFVPQSHAKDGDPVDIVLISSMAIMPGSTVESRPIGMLQMEDEAGLDNKIIAVPIEKIDPFYGKLQDVSDMDEPTRQKIKHFFERYKELEPRKWVKLKDFLSREEAEKEIKESL